MIFISQSGRSPDILDQVKMAKLSGAYCIALINDETSPIVDLVDTVIPLKAGEEKAVAATKSYLLTLSALLQLVSYWGENIKLESALSDHRSMMAENHKQIGEFYTSKRFSENIEEILLTCKI